MSLGHADFHTTSMDPKDSILIVDDDPEIRQLLVDYLARNGFDAKPAGSCYVRRSPRLIGTPASRIFPGRS